MRIDVFSLLNSVETDPTHFRIHPRYDRSVPDHHTVCSDPDHTFFWDVHHPTEFGHAFFAVTLENALAAGKAVPIANNAR